MATISSKKKVTQQTTKVSKAPTIDPNSYPFTWLRALRLAVNLFFFLIINGALVGIAVTWLTLPVNAPPTPWTITSGTFYIVELLFINAIIPFLPLATFFLIGGVFGRYFCGWTCPVGFFQDIIAYLPVKKYYPTKNANESNSVWGLYFAGFIIIISLFIGVSRLYSISTTETSLSSLGIISTDPLAALDPAATLVTFLSYMFFWDKIPFISANVGNADLVWFWLRLGIMAIVFIIPAFIPRAYCRYICPTGAIMGKFGKYSLIGLKRNPVLCNECGDCNSICPMGVRVMDYIDKIKDPMCIGCMDCAYACEEGAIQLKVL
jgi:polyferredoxin